MAGLLIRINGTKNKPTLLEILVMQYNHILMLTLFFSFAYAMDLPPVVTPEYFVEQLRTYSWHNCHQKGTELLHACTPAELEAIWRYAMNKEHDMVIFKGIWICTLLDMMTKAHIKKSSPSFLQGLRKTVRNFCARTDLLLDKPAIEHILNYLLQERGVKNSKGETEWRPIVPDNEALECLDLLLEKGASLDCDTVFYLLASKRFILIDFLLSKKAFDPNGVTRNRIPLWHLARYPQMYNILIRYGNAQIQSVDENGLTVLHQHARNVDIFGATEEYLLKVGSNINAQNNKGDTPLHMAVQRNKKEVQEWLVRHGADCFVKNNKGEYALSITLSKAYTKEVVHAVSTIENLQ